VYKKTFPLQGYFCATAKNGILGNWKIGKLENWYLGKGDVFMSNVFESKHPLVAHKLTRLRDKETKPKKFRELIREVSALLAYEATADLAIAPREVDTPLATTMGAELKQPIGLIPILRSGLGMVEGIWGLMPSAEVWHIGLYRDESTLQPVQYYNNCPWNRLSRFAWCWTLCWQREVRRW